MKTNATPPHSPHIVVALFLTLLVGFGCATSPEGTSEKEATQASKKTPSEDVLFEAILAEVASRDHKVKMASKRFRTVSTTYEKISARLRRRRVLRILMLPQGGALKVTVEVERDEGSEGAPSWTPVETGAMFEQAKQEEMELARAVEKRFHQMR